MNILFSCDEYPPLHTGGIGSATKTVAEGLARKGHNIYVVSGWLPTHNLPFKSTVNGVTIYRIKYFKQVRWIWNNSFISRSVRKILQKTQIISILAIKERDKTYAFIKRLIAKHNIDLVEIPDYTILTKYVSEYKKLYFPKFNVPTVGRFHGNNSFLQYYRDGHINLFDKYNDSAFFDSCDSVLCVSCFAANFLKQYLNYASNPGVIYNPMSENFMVKEKDIMQERSNDIIFIGKLIESKGAFNLIKAFNIFTEQFPEYRLVMIGGGCEENALRYATKNAKKNIKFTGYISSTQIIEYLDKASFAVIPTFFETLGQAAIEVMGRGNILIYTTTSTGPELIDNGIDGFLVDPHDIDAIVNKMIFVAQNIETLHNVRLNAAHKVREKFGENEIINQLEKYYQKRIYSPN